MRLKSLRLALSSFVVVCGAGVSLVQAEGAAEVGCKEESKAVKATLRSLSVAGEVVELGGTYSFTLVPMFVFAERPTIADCRRVFEASAERTLRNQGLGSKVDEAIASAEGQAVLECEADRAAARVYVPSKKSLSPWSLLRNGAPDPDAYFTEDDPHVCPQGLPHHAGQSQIEGEYNPQGESGTRFADCRKVSDGVALSLVRACGVVGETLITFVDAGEVTPRGLGENLDYPSNKTCEFKLTKIRGVAGARGVACYYAYPGAVPAE